MVAASPNSGVNTITGEGLADALVGAQVVVDLANSPSFEAKPTLEFFQTAGRNLLAAEATAGVGHHIALSVVGTDRLQGSGYFRAKLAQENLIKGSTIPYTIVRSTQFFEFMSAIAQSGTVGQARSNFPIRSCPPSNISFTGLISNAFSRPSWCSASPTAGSKPMGHAYMRPRI